MIRRRSSKNRSSKVLIYILSVTIIVAAIVVRYVFWPPGISPKIPATATSTTKVALGKYFSISEKLLKEDLAGWKIWRVTDKNFELKYPREFTKTETEITVPPDYKEKVRATELTYSLPIKHCSLSGLSEHCTSSTQNLSIKFLVADSGFSALYKSLEAKIGKNNLHAATVDGHQGVSYSVGVEGEGETYYIIPLEATKTLVISRSYIDENVVAGYQGVKDFLSYADQKAVFDRVISTLKFNSQLSLYL